jgi:peptide deformylase
MIRSVVKRGSPNLEQPCRKVADVGEVQGIITNLKDTLIAIEGLYNFRRGSGIAAPQIGESWRVDVMHFDKEWYTLINPEIIAHSDEKVLVSEGCLSFFNYRGKALRYADVTVAALDENGNKYTFDSKGDANFSSLIQHELDHLDGNLYVRVMPDGEELVPRPEMPFIP